MSVRDTSIEAYHDHINSGKFSRQQRQILAVIQPGQDYSRLEISRLSGIPINSVCGAVFDLIKKGALIEGPKRPCKISSRTIRPVASRGVA